MSQKTESKSPSVPKKDVKSSAPKPRRYFKGRPVYTEEDAAHPNFVFSAPPEPEWEAEWQRRQKLKAKK